MKIEQRIVALAEAFPTRLCLVGGACRDLLLGEKPKDWDCASALPPEEVMQWGAENNIKVIPTGLGHGTVTLLWEGLSVEITTFRTDHNCDGRHAEVQWASTIEEDLSRRDITINAIAIDLQAMQVIDPFGGQNDLTHWIIRAVGNPEARAQEDYLRILRVPRFAAKFEFEIEQATTEACKKYAHMIPLVVSWERIRDEFNKAFESGKGALFIYYCQNLGILDYLLPGYDGEIHTFSVYSFWMSLFICTEMKVGEFCHKWKLPNDVKRALNDFINGQKLKFATKVSQVREVKDSLKIVSLQEVDIFWGINNPSINHPHLDEKPWITGDDLIAQGMKPGVELGKTLKQKLAEQMDR